MFTKVAWTAGSDLSRQLILFSNVYWAKKIANSISSEPVACITTEPIAFESIKSLGKISRTETTNTRRPKAEQDKKKECVICISPGGEEQWDKLFGGQTSSTSTFIVLNNSFSTSYDLGNKRGYEEAFYLKRISKGWIFRCFPGAWEAFLEKPDGSLEKLKSYDTKPSLREVSELVREEVRLKSHGSLLLFVYNWNVDNVSYKQHVYWKNPSLFISHSSDFQFSTIDGVKVSVGGSKRYTHSKNRWKSLTMSAEKHWIVGSDLISLLEHKNCLELESNRF